MRKSNRFILGCVLLAGGVALGAAGVGMLPPAGVPAAGIQQALESLDRGHYEQAEQKGLALATDPVNPTGRAWAIVGAARQRSGQRVPAAEAYRQFLDSCTCRATQQFAMSQMRACADADREPATPQAPSKRLGNDVIRRLAEVHDRLYTESSEHFVVQARNPELARIVVAESEVALDRICRVILAGRDYPHSVRVNVWTDHDNFLAHAADAPEWSGGSFRLTTANGITTRQIDLTQRDKLGAFATIMLDRVLPHEMCHLVVKEYFGDATCPLFLGEGLAMMAESEVENSRTELAGVAIAGKAKIALKDLFVRRRYDVEKPAIFYAESFSFVEFLHGRMTGEQFRALLEHVKAGCTVADALQRSLYMPSQESFLPALASAWEDHAIEQAQYLRALAANEE